MFDLSTIDFETLYCLFKGEPGTRKSTCALSFPKPIYFFSWDQKMEALLLPMLHWGINPKEIKAEDYFNWDKALADLKKFKVDCPYKTIVIDSITSAADSINRQTLNIKQGGNETGKKIAGIPVNSIEDFNAEDSALKELIAITKDIHSFHKVNIVLIAHVIQVDQKTPDGRTHVSRSLLTAGKKIAAKIPAYCGEVYHFNIEKMIDTSQGGKYGLLTTHVGEDFARTALPIPNEIQFGNEPLYDKWLKPGIDKLREQRKKLMNPPNTDISPKP